MVTRHTSGTSLGFESLEQKQLMAGDVAIGASGGNLFLMGDAADNQIAITSAGQPGAIAVVGLQDTTVSLGGHVHAPGQPAIISGIVGNLVANLNDGNDFVRVDNLAIQGNAVILTGQGNDTVAVSQLFAGRGLHLAAGAGDDSIAVNSVRTPGRVSLAGGIGSDSLVVQDTIAGHNLSVNAGQGGGDGEDSVVLHRTRSARTRVATGLGDDAVRITDSAFGHLGVSLGPGEDQLALGGVSVQCRAWFNGGLGDDLLHELASNHIPHGRTMNFV